MYYFIRLLYPQNFNPLPPSLEQKNPDLFFQELIDHMYRADMEKLGKCIYQDPHMLHAVMFLHPETIELLNEHQFYEFYHKGLRQNIWKDIAKVWENPENFVNCMIDKLKQPLRIFAQQEFRLLLRDYEEMQKKFQHLKNKLPFEMIIGRIPLLQFRKVTQYQYVETSRKDKIMRKIIIMEDDGTQTKINLNQAKNLHNIRMNSN